MSESMVFGRELVRGDRLFHSAKDWRSCGRGWVEYLRDVETGHVQVRCENGAVPTVKLINLQWDAMTDQQELEEFYDELSDGGKLSMRALCHIRAINSDLSENQAAKRDLLAALKAITNSGPDAIPINEAFEMAHRAIERAKGGKV